MKNTKVFLILGFVIILGIFLSACNNVDTDNTTAPEASSADISAAIQESLPSESLSEKTEESETSFSIGEYDLEIITVPATNMYDSADSDDKSEDTFTTNEEADSQSENKTQKQEETKIELPFVPAN